MDEDARGLHGIGAYEGDVGMGIVIELVIELGTSGFPSDPGPETCTSPCAESGDQRQQKRQANAPGMFHGGEALLQT